MEGHLTMSKKERARLVVMAKVMKSGMKIIEALRGGSRDAATVADRGRLWQKWRPSVSIMLGHFACVKLESRVRRRTRHDDCQ